MSIFVVVGAQRRDEVGRRGRVGRHRCAMLTGMRDLSFLMGSDVQSDCLQRERRGEGRVRIHVQQLLGFCYVPRLAI